MDLNTELFFEVKKQTKHFSSSEIKFYSFDMKSSTSTLNPENHLKL